MISGNAIVITGGLLAGNHAKTAHGLIRGSERFTVKAVIDNVHAGKDAGEILDGKNRNIPVFASITDFINSGIQVDYAIIGVATKGGVVPEDMRVTLKEVINEGISVVNGLHQHLSTIPDIVALAKENGVQLHDIRKSKPYGEARFWNGEIMEVKCPKLAVLGTDCALGKRTTTRFLTQHLQAEGIKAEMIYTGQTGWMQGVKHGFIFDATVNDFISGEVEGAVLRCYREENPDMIIIEGQSSLRNPSGPCGTEFIISARLDGVILQHNPKRVHYKDMEYYPDLVAQPAEEIKLIKMFGAPVIALALNTMNIDKEEAEKLRDQYEKELGIPVVLPLYEGVGRIADACKKLMK
ncbi:MAG: DUF1611 domain-containing protein [Cyclobacteriaceae bacterium]|nr:DUF1611 domain-containing protein [Cyclobacteriaceae bacterium]